MPKERLFWVLSVLILLSSGVSGFWFVPDWAYYLQDPEQRMDYLSESIWCPI